MSKVQSINKIKSTDLTNLVNEFVAVNQSKQAIEKSYKEIEQALLDKMKKLGYSKIELNSNYENLYHIASLAIVAENTYNSLDTAKLKTEYAEIYEKCYTKQITRKAYVKATKA